MPSGTHTRSPLTLLALAVVVCVAVALIARASRPKPPGEELAVPPGCEGLTVEECRATQGVQGMPESLDPEPSILRADEVCVDVGYLCAEVQTEGNLHLLRWPRETDLVRIWVPEPEGLPPGLAREFQRAAVRGIQAWNGHPLPLSIRTRSSGETPDVTVGWLRTVDEGRLGRAQVEWKREGARVEYKVVGFTLATHRPGAAERELTPEEVELVAAHEMGHALGLPHSDDPRDVMFPTNTATRLTSRDFRTMEAVYSLPNGVRIRR